MNRMENTSEIKSPFKKAPTAEEAALCLAEGQRRKSKYTTITGIGGLCGLMFVCLFLFSGGKVFFFMFLLTGGVTLKFIKLAEDTRAVEDGWLDPSKCGDLADLCDNFIEVAQYRDEVCSQGRRFLRSEFQMLKKYVEEDAPLKANCNRLYCGNSAMVPQ